MPLAIDDGTAVGLGRFFLVGTCQRLAVEVRRLVAPERLWKDSNPRRIEGNPPVEESRIVAGRSSGDTPQLITVAFPVCDGSRVSSLL